MIYNKKFRKLSAACLLFLFLLGGCGKAVIDPSTESPTASTPAPTESTGETQEETLQTTPTEETEITQPTVQTSTDETMPDNTEKPQPKPTDPAPTEKPQPKPTEPTQETQQPAKGYSSVDEIIANMTLYEKICQMLIVTPEQLTGVSPVTVAGDATRNALNKMPVGGIIYNSANLKNKTQVRSLLANTQSYSKIPLILTCDEEGGRVTRLMRTVGTTYIGPMYQYKDQGTETARKNALTIASDMRSLGFNADMAPVADVWSNPGNTVIGDRAYSDSFTQAAELIPAAITGFHQGGIATALKHFPGHGDTSADSHNGAVYVYKTLDALRQEEFLSFQAGINAGSDMVMIGHLIMADIDSQQPAPFSYRIVTQLLRGELGFNGVVISDALDMKALTNSYSSGEIARRCVAAGVDILLMPKNANETVKALQDAVASGEISEARINESVRRILNMKVRRGILTLTK